MQVATVTDYEEDHISGPIEIPDETPTPAAIRRAHRRTETSVKAIGSLLLVYVALGCLALFRSSLSPGMPVPGLLPALLGASLLIASGIGGTLLRELDPRGRWIYTILFLVHLVLLGIDAPALNTLLGHTASETGNLHGYDHPVLSLVLLAYLVHGAFLYILWSRKGRTVMGRHYRRTIIPATPHIR